MCNRLELFKVLILCSQESECQRGLRNHCPARIGKAPIVQLTQARDGAVPQTAHPTSDLPLVHAGFIICDITHPPAPPRVLKFKGGQKSSARRPRPDRFPCGAAAAIRAPTAAVPGVTVAASFCQTAASTSVA